MGDFIRSYSFGGINLRLHMPCEFISQEPFSLFTTQKKDENTYISQVISAGDNLREFDGEEIYRSDKLHVRVKKNGEKTAVYLGFYKNAEKPNREFAVILRDESMPNEQKVYIIDDVMNNPCERQIMSAMGIEHILVRGGGLILHSSYIETEFGGLLFTAPKGTGKSTQAEIWKSYKNAVILNGDRALVTVKGNTVTANGIPYSGSSGICRNKSLPIAAIVELSQAKENSIHRLNGVEAFKVLLNGTWVNVWDSTDMTLATDTAIKIAQSVPMFRLSCLPDVSAADLLEKELYKLQGGR